MTYRQCFIKPEYNAQKIHKEQTKEKLELIAGDFYSQAFPCCGLTGSLETEWINLEKRIELASLELENKPMRKKQKIKNKQNKHTSPDENFECSEC